MTVERDLLLLAPWSDAGRDVWLVLDLVTGLQVRQLPVRPDYAVDAGPAVIVPVGSRQCRLLPDGNLLVGEGVLWSLLDPLNAGHGTPVAADDRQLTETELRRAAARLRRRLQWWRKLEESVRVGVRSRLRGFRPDLTPLFDLLDGAAAMTTLSGGPVDATEGTDADEPEPADDIGAPYPSLAPPDLTSVGAPDAVAAWFTDPDGLGYLYGPEFSPRGEQADTAGAVAAALQQRTPLLVEAGTGVGKTLAYLVPLLAALEDGEQRAVISTHTRALQRQILEQDLPRLQPLLGERRFALLMGRSNYLCRRQREAFLSRGTADFDEALQTAAFLIWLAETEEGMREELVDHPVLAGQCERLFDSADLCLPQLCYDGKSCFVQRARRRAREADLLVVNHALLMADLQAGGTLIGEVDHLVVDEAHRLPAVALEAHGVVCGLRRLAEIEDLIGAVTSGDRLPERIALSRQRLTGHGAEGQKAAAAAETYGRAVTTAFAAFRRWWRALGAHVDEVLTAADRQGGRLRVRDKDEAFAVLRGVTADVLEALAAAIQDFASLAGRTSPLDDLAAGLEDDLAQIAQSSQLLRRLHQDIRFLTVDPDDDWVTWLEPGFKGGVRRLGATRLEAGPLLRDYWLETDLAPVMTSATLAVGEDFTHMLNELGLTRRRPPAVTFTSASPFDYHTQTLVLAPARFPAPQAPDFGRAVGELLRELYQRVPRKTMGLFTSYRVIDEVAEVLADAGLAVDDLVERSDDDEMRLPRLRAHGSGASRMQVLAQSPRTEASALIDQFRRSRRSLLLGTSTFWEGVDLPGADLEILIVSKLPFLVPTDPWVEARCEKISAAGENPFTSFMVRDAVLRLRQGFGRLIRRRGDRGVFLVLDSRLHTKNYGVTFLNSLPVMPAVFNGTNDLLDRIETFFLSGRG